MADSTDPGAVSPPTKTSATERDTPFVLMCIVAAGFIGALLMMGFHDVPAANKDLLNTLLGSLGTAFALVVGFYFGSSASSRSKDTTITNLSKGN